MIYFIQAGESGPIKIGYVDGVHRHGVAVRLGLLQVGNHERLTLRATMPGWLNEERGLHQRFKRGHLRGEWFDPHTPGLQEVIDSAPDDEGVTSWMLRSDGQQICEWCRTGVVIPPRRALCSEACSREAKKARNKASRKASKSRSPTSESSEERDPA